MLTRASRVLFNNFKKMAELITAKSKELFFSNPQMDLLETTAQRVLMQSGVGSGKSHCIGMVAFDFISYNPEVRGFIGANTYGQLTKSTLDRVFKVWEEVYNLRKGVHYVVDRIPPENYKIIGPALKTYENTISFNNGGLIFLASLDNYKVIDGTEFAWALLDETKDTKEEAVKEVIIARLRQPGMLIDATNKIHKSRKYNVETGKVDDILKMKLENGVWTYDEKQDKYFTENRVELKGYTPLYVFTSPAKAKWLMNWFRLDEDAEEIEKCIYSETDYYRKRKGDQLVIISSTYHNKQNLSPGYIDRLLNDLAGNPGRVKMLIYGSPFGKTGGEYYNAYSRLVHIKKFDIWEDEAVHLSFDFNVVPYMTCLCFQIKFNNEKKRFLVRCFDEFCLPNPDNSTPALCRAIIKKYEHIFKKGSVYFYGDYNGKSRQTMSEEYRNQYSVIEEALRRYLNNNSDRVIVNPMNIIRRDFMNKIFIGGFPIDFEIHERCKEFRGDCEFVKEDVNGGKLKTRITIDGVNFEEHGHTSDAAEYFFCSAFNNLLNLP